MTEKDHRNLFSLHNLDKTLKFQSYQQFQREKMISRPKTLLRPFVTSFGRVNWSKPLRKSASTLSLNPEEFVVIHPNAKQTVKQLQQLKFNYRPNLQILYSNDNRLPCTTGYWYLANGRFVLDSLPLDTSIDNSPQQTSSTKSIIPEKWNELIEQRLKHEFQLKTDSNYEKELNAAMSVISRNCFMSRSYQHHFFSKNSSTVKKKDKTVVTLVDFATQAMIIEKLSKHFPNDKFIAEEDSSMLKENPELCEDVVQYIRAVTNDLSWDREKLFHYLDLGSYSGDVCNERVWALDPIDGTKGFVTGLHYCISIVLLDHGKPKISVIGCPNLNIYEILAKRGQSAMIAINENIIFDNMKKPTTADDTLSSSSTFTSFLSASSDPSSIGFPFHERGSLYYSVTGHGAYARSLTMPLNESFKVSVSTNSKLSESTLCEASETSRHDHLMTKSVATLLKMETNDPIRLHSQCKYCIVGAGGSEGTIRYPPRSYVEKVWDHAAGAHFVIEAGGSVTDLHGFELEVNIGRNLDHHVRGIIASNGKIHNQLLYAVHASLQP